MRVPFVRIARIFLPVLPVMISAAQATTYYVSPTGNDNSNPGTLAAPFRTIQRGHGAAGPGDTVLVQNGTYTTNSTQCLVSISKGGAAGAYITYRAANKWGVVLSGSDYTTNFGFEWANSSSYVRVEGFAVTGFRSCGVSFNLANASHLEFRNNHFHDIGGYCDEDAWGNTAIFWNGSDDIIVESNVIDDIGRLQAGACSYSPDFIGYQNLDHGLYFENASNVMIRNNVFYNHFAGWAVQVIENTDGVQILNNTFYGANPNRPGQILLCCGTHTNVSIKNNIFYGPGGGDGVGPCGVGFYSSSGGPFEISKNITYSPTETVSVVAYVTGSVSGVTIRDNLVDTDPLLKNPGSYDFGLTAASPAINAGLDLAGSGVTGDIDDVLRPAGQYDIGAYEYAPGAFINFLPSAPENVGSINMHQAGTGLMFTGFDKIAKASVTIYSPNGSKVAFFSNVGSNALAWNPGRSIPGVYLVKVNSGVTAQTTKVFCAR